MRSFALALFLFLCATPAFADPVRIFLVRHAEKVLEPKTDDPLLTDAGTKRALALERALRSARIKAIYTSEFKRTKLTVAPLEKKLGIAAKEIKADDVKGLVKALLSAKAQEVLLVAGHSNTIPVIIKELGVSEKVELTDADYDGLYLVLREDGRSTLVRLHYGD